jgi:hypothetical protein
MRMNMSCNSTIPMGASPHGRTRLDLSLGLGKCLVSNDSQKRHYGGLNLF